MLPALLQNDFGRCWKACMEHSIASNGKLTKMECNAMQFTGK
jgi:hypothetical protein